MRSNKKKLQKITKFLKKTYYKNLKNLAGTLKNLLFHDKYHETFNPKICKYI